MRQAISISGPRAFTRRLANALGITRRGVKCITLRAHYQEFPTVDVEFQMTEEGDGDSVIAGIEHFDIALTPREEPKPSVGPIPFSINETVRFAIFDGHRSLFADRGDIRILAERDSAGLVMAECQLHVLMEILGPRMVQLGWASCPVDARMQIIPDVNSPNR